MIDIPVGKAIAAVYSDIQCHHECDDDNFECNLDCCKGCEIENNQLEGIPDSEVCGCLCCTPYTRRDGRKIVFKLVDYPVG